MVVVRPLVSTTLGIYLNLILSYILIYLLYLGRRPTQNSAATEDEPLAWEAREFVRKLCVGKQVFGHVVHTANRSVGTDRT